MSRADLRKAVRGLTPGDFFLRPDIKGEHVSFNRVLRKEEFTFTLVTNGNWVEVDEGMLTKAARSASTLLGLIRSVDSPKENIVSYTTEQPAHENYKQWLEQLKDACTGAKRYVSTYVSDLFGRDVRDLGDIYADEVFARMDGHTFAMFHTVLSKPIDPPATGVRASFKAYQMRAVPNYIKIARNQGWMNMRVDERQKIILKLCYAVRSLHDQGYECGNIGDKNRILFERIEDIVFLDGYSVKTDHMPLLVLNTRKKIITDDGRKHDWGTLMTILKKSSVGEEGFVEYPMDKICIHLFNGHPHDSDEYQKQEKYILDCWSKHIALDYKRPSLLFRAPEAAEFLALFHIYSRGSHHQCVLQCSNGKRCGNEGKYLVSIQRDSKESIRERVCRSHKNELVHPISRIPTTGGCFCVKKRGCMYDTVIRGGQKNKCQVETTCTSGHTSSMFSNSKYSDILEGHTPSETAPVRGVDMRYTLISRVSNTPESSITMFSIGPKIERIDFKIMRDTTISFFPMDTDDGIYFRYEGVILKISEVTNQKELSIIESLQEYVRVRPVFRLHDLLLYKRTHGGLKTPQGAFVPIQVLRDQDNIARFVITNEGDGLLKDENFRRIFEGVADIVKINLIEQMMIQLTAMVYCLNDNAYYCVISPETCSFIYTPRKIFTWINLSSYNADISAETMKEGLLNVAEYLWEQSGLPDSQRDLIDTIFTPFKFNAHLRMYRREVKSHLNQALSYAHDLRKNKGYVLRITAMIVRELKKEHYLAKKLTEIQNELLKFDPKWRPRYEYLNRSLYNTIIQQYETLSDTRTALQNKLSKQKESLARLEEKIIEDRLRANNPSIEVIRSFESKQQRVIRDDQRKARSRDIKFSTKSPLRVWSQAIENHIWVDLNDNIEPMF